MAREAASKENTRVIRLLRNTRSATHSRHRVIMPADWSAVDLPVSLVERKAHALRIILSSMPIFIEDDELIVGSRTVFASNSPGQLEINDYSDLNVNAYPPYAAEEEKRRLGGQEGFSKGHYVAGYKKVLNMGIGGLIAQARERIRSEQSQTKRDFLNAVCIAWEGVSLLANRYADLALQMASTHPGVRTLELRRIADVCRHVSLHPPRSFHDALQLFWFAHLAIMIENFGGVCFGRVDQHLWPFYQSASRVEAQELLECFLIKLNDQADLKIGDVVTYAGTDNLMLSGLTPRGEDGTNHLTYAILDAFEKLRLASPQINVRLHKGSPDRLVMRACELACQGINNIAFYNDEAIVPSLAGVGFPIEDARDYALDLCQDIEIDGRSDFFLGGQVSLTHVLLDTLEKVDSGVTFEQLLQAYKDAIAAEVCAVVERYNSQENVTGNETISPLPLLSATLDDCIETGLDVTQGGVRFKDKGIFLVSPVNAVNSLAAIRQVVYERGIASLAEVREACRSNYEGREALRQQLLAAPKWGNDDDRVDLIAKEVFEHGLREILKYRTASGARFLAGIHQPHTALAGRLYRATPDGRKDSEPVPVTLSPSNGTDRKGPTAIIKSVTKIDPMLCQWNSALTLKFGASMAREPGAAMRLGSLLKTYFDLGGIELQTNVLDAEELRAAQLDPENHRDIIVRIWGMSAYFVDICRELQDDIIARTELGL